jgi:predicted nuclease of predicted toxin-antitoxin system
MKFFLDENFPKPAADLLTARGHEVFDIRSTEFEGSNDSQIFELAQAEGAIFLTTDKDFFHTIPFFYQKHKGIIVITLRQPNRRGLIEKLLFALDHIDLTAIESKVLLLKDTQFSIT